MKVTATCPACKKQYTTTYPYGYRPWCSVGCECSEDPPAGEQTLAVSGDVMLADLLTECLARELDARVTIPLRSNSMLSLDINLIAQGVHAAIRAYNASIGDAELPAWEDLDPQLQASTVTGVQSALAGATPRQQHEQWMQTRIADGWTYGPITDRLNKVNSCLVPYDDLPQHQRVKDDLFLAATRSAVMVYSLLRA